MAKEECQLCHSMVKGPLHSKDGVCICFDCAKIVATNANMKMINFSAYLWTFNELNQMYNQSSKASELIIEQDERRENMEKQWEQLQEIEASGVKFDHYHKAITLPRPNFLHLDLYDSYSYNNIMKFEYYEDATLVTEGGMGKAIVGGLLFGAVGAVIGSSGTKSTTRKVEKQEVHITMRIPGTSEIKIYKIDVSHAFEYSKEKAEKLILLLQEAINQIKSKDTDINTSSMKETVNHEDIPSQIRKFKELMDDGIITKEEFEEKKKQLLQL